MAEIGSVMIGQRAQFVRLGVPAPNSRSVATDLLEYLVNGFPYGRNLTEAERVARYLAASNEWVNAHVRFKTKNRWQTGWVDYLRPQRGTAVRTTHSSVNTETFVAVIRLDDKAQTIVKSLDQVTKFVEGEPMPADDPKPLRRARQLW